MGPSNPIVTSKSKENLFSLSHPFELKLPTGEREQGKVIYHWDKVEKRKNEDYESWAPFSLFTKQLWEAFLGKKILP